MCVWGENSVEKCVCVCLFLSEQCGISVLSSLQLDQAANTPVFTVQVDSQGKQGGKERSFSYVNIRIFSFSLFLWCFCASIYFQDRASWVWDLCFLQTGLWSACCLVMFICIEWSGRKKSDASQTPRERGPAACRVRTTSPPSLLQNTIIGCQRYQLEPAQLFPQVRLQQ